MNLNGVSEGHDACKPIGTRWVEPVLLGTNPVIVHPNALGESKMAEQTIKVLESKTPGNPLPSARPPQTTIRKSVVRNARRKATFRFTSSAAGSTFRCKLDQRPFRKCRLTRTYKRLKPGKHKFRVAAVDFAGQVDPTPAKRKFRIRR